MSEKARRLIQVKDLIELVGIPILAVISWTVPERHWDSIARGIASLFASLRVGRTSLRVGRTRARQERHWRRFRDRIDPSKAKSIETTVYAHFYVARMQAYRDYRPGGWHPEIQVTGTEHIEAAREKGYGVLLWVAPFIYSDLVAKKGLHDAGYRVSHLSRPSHGFTPSLFGVRILNPIWTRIEDRYLAERVCIADGRGSGSALKTLYDRLEDNQVVSITFGREARKTAQVAFMGSSVRIATGPMHLARNSKAVLLPVYTVRRDTGILTVNIESPLIQPTEDNDDEPYEAIVQKYVQKLEEYVLSYPGQWKRSWVCDQ